MHSIGGQFFRVGAAVVATGVSVKMMDDYLDKDLDLHGNIYHVLKEGLLPYALVALALGSLGAPSIAVSLFLSAYCLGMAFSPLDRLPTDLVGYQEFLVLMLVQFLLLPWVRVLNSLAVIACVQILDDLIDQDIDQGDNLVQRLGFGEAMIIGGFCLILGVYTDWMVTVWAMLLMVVINLWQPGDFPPERLS
ncbi:MAG: hypothetical protein M0Q40_02650 [Limnochordia bacterium]|jgi:4-hydroxybenzoate polyprenyltransferase|nr:hypothetical protein [Limnochordia bacterium]